MTPEPEIERSIDALRPVYELWARGEDIRALFDLYAPGMTWGWSEEFPDIHGTYDDPQAAGAVIEEWFGQWENWRIEAEEFVPVGDRVVVLARYRGIGRGSGVRIDTPGAHVWTMRGGQAVGLMVFSDRVRALRWASEEDRLDQPRSEGA